MNKQSCRQNRGNSIMTLKNVKLTQDFLALLIQKTVGFRLTTKKL